MSLEIRRKGNKNFTHIDSDFDNQYGANDITIIFEGNTIKIRSFNGRIIFKRDGYNLSEVTIYDDTASGSQENFNDINLFKQRLINLGYPFAGGSVSGDGIPEAPNDGQQYGRQSEGWTVVTGGSGGGIPEAPNDGQQYARQSEAWSVVTGGGATLTKDVNQVGHGFSVGDVIRLDGSNYVKAQADSVNNANAISFVVSVTDADNFVLQSEGYTIASLGLSNGDEAFLSTTVLGGIQTTEPTNGEINLYLGQQTPQGFLISISTGFVVGGVSPTESNCCNYIDIPNSTPSSVDDEFSQNKIDISKWVINKGKVGKVDILDTSLLGFNESVIDMTTKSNSLLVQTGQAKDFEIFQDYTLLDGESIILKMSSVIQLTQTLEGFIDVGLCVGDGLTANSGNYITLKFASNNDGWYLIQERTGAVLDGALGDVGSENATTSKDVYFRISRLSNGYQGFFSFNGKTWTISNYLDVIPQELDRIFIYSKSTATQAGSPLPITEFEWIRKGDNSIVPWNNIPTNPPIIISSILNSGNEYVSLKFSEKIKQQDLINSNFSINYTQNGDDVASVSILNIKNSIGNNIQEDTDEIRVYLSYSLTPTGLGFFEINVNNVQDVFNNVLISEQSDVIFFNGGGSIIDSDTNIVAYWEHLVGDNDTTSPYSKTDSKNGYVLTSNGDNEPNLLGDGFWSFGNNSGFKNQNSQVISPFTSTNRDCQIHYISKFSSGFQQRSVQLSDNINNKYNNFLYQGDVSNTIDFSLGSAGSTLTQKNITTISLDTPYLFSVKFYQDLGVTKVDYYINDGLTDVFSAQGLDVSSYPAPSLNGFFWSMREQSGGVKAYYDTKIKSCLISESSQNFDLIREELKQEV